MKIFVKILIAFVLAFMALSFSRCSPMRKSDGRFKTDSLVMIPYSEYELLKQRADERYVVVQRRTYDSLLMKTKALQELCDQLVKHLPEEIRSEKKPSDPDEQINE